MTKDKEITFNAIYPGTQSLTHHYHIAATSDNTRRAYQADIRHYESWGGRLPATTDAILRYLHAFAKILNPRTLARHLTAIKQWHRTQHFPDPTDATIIKKTLTGITRIHGKPKVKAPPLLPEHLIKINTYLLTQIGLAACRDNAMLQMGFLGAFRRSELVAIKIEHIHWQPEGIEILIPTSKTDALNEGQFCVIPNGNTQLCAISALKKWLALSKIKEGFIFRRITRGNKISQQKLSADFVNEMLKKHARSAGIKNSIQFSSHSMRRGLATSASREGVSISAIMRQGRWKQVNTVMEYIEAAKRFEENAAYFLLEKHK